MGYDWDFAVFAPYAGAFARASWVTVELAAVSSVVGTVFGFAIGLVLRYRQVAWFLLPINDVFRAVPLLVWLFFAYYFPYRDVFGVTPLSECNSALVALTFVQAIFTADLVRAAVNGVSAQAILGARALGLSRADVWRYIILPDVLRQILPSLLAFWIGNVKLSSLASVIGCREVVFTARVAMGQTFRSLEAWVIVGAIYVIIVVPLAWGARVLERSEWMRRRT